MSSFIALNGGAYRSAGTIHNDGNPKQGEIIDKRTGLTAHLHVDYENKKVNIVFGGTLSGISKSEGRWGRLLGNFSSTLSQIVTDIKVGIGILPHSLQQATNLTQTVVDSVESSEVLKDFEVVAVGHSKGSAEAVFSALSLNKPIKAVTFSSADLGGRLVRKLPPENVARATQLVTATHVKGDKVPNLRYILPSLRPLGVERVIPANPAVSGKHSPLPHTLHYVSQQLAV